MSGHRMNFTGQEIYGSEAINITVHIIGNLFPEHFISQFQAAEDLNSSTCRGRVSIEALTPINHILYSILANGPFFPNIARISCAWPGFPSQTLRRCLRQRQCGNPWSLSISSWYKSSWIMKQTASARLAAAVPRHSQARRTPHHQCASTLRK